MKRTVVLVAVLAALPNASAQNTNARVGRLDWPEQPLLATPCLAQPGDERGPGCCGACRVRLRVENAFA
jgi:hypothetical protein